MARDPHDHATEPPDPGLGSNESQAAEHGAPPERPQTGKLADRQEGDHGEHVEDLAGDIEGLEERDGVHAADGQRTPPDAANAPGDSKPPGSRAPG